MERKNDQNIGWTVPPVAYQYPNQPGYPPAYAPAANAPQPVYPAGYAPQPVYPAGYAPQPGYPGATASSVYPTAYATQPIPVANMGAQGNFPGYSVGGPAHGSDAEAPKPEPLPDSFGESFSSRAIRHKFVRKVYTIVTCQLLVSLGFIALFTLHEGVQLFVQQNAWTVYLAYGTFLVTYIILICCTSVRRKWPGNMIMLSVFTLAMSYLLGAISSFYKTEIVLMSIGITTIICFLITMFAIQTKFDFTGCGIYLFIASCILLIFGIITIFTSNRTMNLVYSAGIVLLFSMYLIFDTQRIIGGRKHELSSEEHISGALVLYIDIVNIFLGILGLSRYS